MFTKQKPKRSKILTGMKRMIERLEEEAILNALKTEKFGRAAFCFEEIDSTNAFAKRLAIHGEPEGTLVYAESQTRGRGRWSRSWDSAKGKGLWFSLILRPDWDASSVSKLTLMAVTSMALAVERLTGLNPKVRWPNDLMMGEKKLAGLLAETSVVREDVSYVVLGMGINVLHARKDFSADVRDKAISLRMAGVAHVDRVSLLSEILLQLENDYKAIASRGFDFVLQRWASRSSILGKDVLVRVNHHEVEGVVKGFHDNGDLVLVAHDGEERRYSNGDVVEVRDAVRR